MKKAVIVISCFLVLLTAAAQRVENPVDKVYEIVEKMPVYAGGEVAMMTFIQRNIRYPDLEREHDIQGRVIVSFIVERNGELSDIHIQRSVTKGIDAEALRVVRLMPKFTPGESEGQVVRVRMLLPIKFKLAGNDDEMSTTVDTAVKKSGLKDEQMLYQKGKVYLDYDNYQSAYPWLKAAAERHYPAALYNVGWMTTKGKGCEKDEAAGLKYEQEAADSNYSDAQVELGYMYENGIGTTGDKTIAAKWYKRAADLNNRVGIANLALFYKSGYGGVGSNDTMARALYMKAAEMGNSRAQYEIGYMYEQGEGGLPVDSTKALVWYKRAEAQGYPMALVKMGDYAAAGAAGMRHSESIASSYYQRAGESGNAYALYQLAWRYEYGKGGMALDTGKAMHYYDLSAALNNAGAQNNYAWLCYLTHRDTAKGVEYVKKAMKANPKDRNRIDTYAALLFLQGDYAEAERQQKIVLDMEGDKTAGYLERYGNILMKLNRKEEALKYWKQAVSLPDHSPKLPQEIEQGKYLD